MIKPSTLWPIRASRHIFVILLSYGTIILAVPEAFEVINAPFYGNEVYYSNRALASYATDVFKWSCFNSSDNGPLLTSLILGWLPALIYAGWWEIVWASYHTRKTKLITPDFKRDWVSKTVVFLSLALPILISLWLAAVEAKVRG